MVDTRRLLKRSLKALGTLLANLLLWYFLPLYIYSFFGLTLPNELVGFAIFISILASAGKFFQDRGIGGVMLAVSSAVEAAFIYLIANGGCIHMSVGWIAFDAEFRLLLYLLMLSPIVEVVKHIWGAIDRSVYRSMSARV